MKPAMDHFGQAIWALHKHILDFKTLINDDTIKAINDATLRREENEATKWIDKAFKKAIFDATNSELEKIVNTWHKNFSTDSGEPKDIFLHPVSLERAEAFRDAKRLKRWLVARFLRELYNSDENLFDAVGALRKRGKFIVICYSKVTYDLVDKEWADVVRLKPKMGMTTKIIKKLAAFVVDAVGVKQAYKQVFNTDKPKLGWDRRVWDGKGGKIIFSDEKNTTYRVEESQIKKWIHADLACEGMLQNALRNTK
jgi:hypothetical protein